MYCASHAHAKCFLDVDLVLQQAYEVSGVTKPVYTRETEGAVRLGDLPRMAQLARGRTLKKSLMSTVIV